MDIKEIKRIVELVKANDLTEFSMKDGPCELVLKRGGNEHQMVYAPAPFPHYAAPGHAAPPSAAPVPASSAEDADDGLEAIPSPIVGTFYRKPAPDADAFVQVGTQVAEDTVVCIIEAMKVMNEIKADVNGVVRKVLVDDAAPVQYGQPLFLVESR